MVSLNKTYLMGNLTRDPELRYLPSGTAVTTFTIAVNRTYTLQSGEKKEEVIFMPVVAWGRRAETCAEFLNKGSAVFVEGRLRSKSWEGQDGQKRSRVEVVADNVQFLGSRGRRDTVEVDSAGQSRQEPLNIVPDVDIPPDNAKGKDAAEDEVPF